MICKLSDIVNTANTGADAIKKAPILNEPTNLRCLRIGDVSQKRDFSMWGYTKTSKMDYERYKLHKGDSIIARTGNTIGVCTYIEDDIESVYNNGLIRLTAKTELARERFLFYLIRSTACQDYIQSIAYGTSTQPNMKIKDFLNFDIIVPTLEIQDKIIAIVDKIEKKIQVNTEINNNLEQQAQTIFDSMFPNITNGENTIGDTITPKRGKGLLSKNAVFGNVPVVAGGLEPSTYHNTANTKAPVLAISASGANAGFVSLWNIPIWSSDSSFIDSSMTDDVYFWYVLLKKRQREIYDSQTGSAQPHIYPQHIAAMPISDLNFDDVRNYTSIVTPIFEMIGHNKDENARLATTRDTLLPKLMSGELDVSNI